MDETTAVETETRIPLDLPKDVVTGPPKAADRDFFASLYSGDVASGPLEPSSLTPEDYYAYLESWYRAQKGLHSQTAAFLEQQTVAGLGGGGEGHVGHVGHDGRVAFPHGHHGRPLVLHEVSSPGGGSGISAMAVAAAAAGGIPSLSSSSSAARRAAFAGGVPPPPRSTSTSTLPSSAGQNQHSGIYIPVSALENLRTSMPALAR